MSPLLWVLHFDEFLRLMEAWDSRESGGAAGGKNNRGIKDGDYLCLVYADDVAILFAHKDADVLVSLATEQADRVRKALRRLGLWLGEPKCNNLVISPGAIVGETVFRRDSRLSATAGAEPPARDRRLGDLLSSIADEQLPAGVFPRESGMDSRITTGRSFGFWEWK